MVTDAESAWSTSESVRIRREATLVDAAAQIYRMSYRLSLTQSDLRDRDDIIRDIGDATKETHDNLVDRSLSGWDESDMEDELDARFEVSAFSAGGWPNVSNFADLPDDSTLRQGILDLSAARIMLGDGMYVRPYSPVTRAEFMKLVAASTCLEPGIRDNAAILRDRLSAYVDASELTPTIPKATSLGGYLALALDRAIIRGVDSSHLAPNRPITRFEAAKILSEVYDLDTASLPPTGGIGFVDTPSGEVGTYVGLATRAGFFSIPPVDAPRFRPNDSLTRGEAAKIIANGVRNQGKALTTLSDESIGMIPSDLFTR